MFTKEVNLKENTLLIEVVPLIEDFIDVFPKDLSEGLPLIRVIEHQIDLVLEASLPNKRAYKTNPTETKALQKQVKELVDKGYESESLSPCVVLVVSP